MAWYDCPKCASPNAWREIRGDDVWLRCLCGYLKVVDTRLESVTIPLSDKSKSLPRQNTMLWDCLMMLSGLEYASTTEITARLNIVRARQKELPLSTRDVATQLSVLWQSKGLVYPRESRERLAGGSTWELTDEAIHLINTKGK